MNRRSRLSLTRADRTTTAGLELLALLQEIADDGVLTPDEVIRLGEWLEGNAAADLPARAYLAGIITDVQRDGRITDEELTLVYDAVLRVLPPELRTLAARRRREQRRMMAVQKTEARSAETAARREQRGRDRVLDRADFMVAGIRHGEHRREACEALDEGDRVWLVREPENRYDRNAIVVENGDGDELGYVPREVAADLASILDAGARQDTTVKKLLETSRGWIIPVVVARLYGRESSLGFLRRETAPRVRRAEAQPVVSPPPPMAMPPSVGSPPPGTARTPWTLLALLGITILLAWLSLSILARM